MNNVIKLVPSKKNRPVTSGELFDPPTAVTPDEFIRNSFYLPVDVLTSDKFKIESIKITSGQELRNFVATEEADKWSIVAEGASHNMLWVAKQIGVSCRQILATGEKIMVVKLWYGDSK